MKKKSGKKAAAAFRAAVTSIERVVADAENAEFPQTHLTWIYDYAVISLYREFEALVLECLVAAINNNTAQLSATTGVLFPKHLTDEVCEYIVVGDGYFDFRGRDGLIKTLRRFLPDTHYLVAIAKSGSYRGTLDRLNALRNFAAHRSRVAKKRALEAINGRYLSSPGAWLKKQGRFFSLTRSLLRLSDEIAAQATH